uniref:hypothetical protein n=1 Tax=uncultured Draconibacterium sp. TaxID=1573823 RepID=UPI003217724A
MKKYIVFIIAIVLTISVSAQKENFFSLQKMKSGRIILEPNECYFSQDGKKQGMIDPNNEYFQKVFCPIMKECFTIKQLQHMSIKKNRVYVSFYFNSEGSIIYAKFFVKGNVLSVIDEKHFQDFYLKIRKIKLDTTQWGEIDERYLDKDDKFDFATLNMPLIQDNCNCPEE